MAWAANLEQESDFARMGNLPARTFAQMAERYATEVSILKAGARWEKLRLARIAQDAFFRHRLCHAITPDDLGVWRDSRRLAVSDATVRRELNLLGSVFEHARREWRWVRTNPVRDVRKPADKRPRRRGVSAAEVKAIVDALGWQEACRAVTRRQQVALAFLLAIETAMRAGELLGLTWQHVDLRQRVAHLPKTKNGEARDVPLSSRAAELVKMLPATDRMPDARLFDLTPSQLDWMFRKAKTACGLAAVHFHDSRAEALTRLSDKLDVLELARMVGHRNPASLMMYYRKSAAEIAKKLG